MSFENKNTNNRTSSKAKAPINNINSNNNSYAYFNNNKESLVNKKKKALVSEDLKKELAEAESFLEKANKDFLNLKTTKETKKEITSDYYTYTCIDDAAMKFIQKTLEEKNILTKQSLNNKIPMQQFLKENEMQTHSSSATTIEKNSIFINQHENVNSLIATSVANTNNNVENSNFDNNFYLSNQSKENVDLQLKSQETKNQNLLFSKDYLGGENNLMSRYLKQLKSHGFPDIGKIFCQSENDMQLLFKFFDYILIKKSNENGDKLKLKKTVIISS